jgi:hypothetical protein
MHHQIGKPKHLILQRDFAHSVLKRYVFGLKVVILSLSKGDGVAKPAPFDRLRVLADTKSRCSTNLKSNFLNKSTVLFLFSPDDLDDLISLFCHQSL